MLLEIVKWKGEPLNYGTILRRQIKPVTIFDQQLADLASNMIETMYAANGIGLAAPQVGIDLSLFVMWLPTGPEVPYGLLADTLIVINPKLVASSRQTDVQIEGCLSIPGSRGEVERPSQIFTIYETQTFQKTARQFKGLAARIFQHEYDHLQGMLFVDRAKNTVGQPLDLLKTSLEGPEAGLAATLPGTAAY